LKKKLVARKKRRHQTEKGAIDGSCMRFYVWQLAEVVGWEKVGIG
jgi:hypothetical protein